MHAADYGSEAADSTSGGRAGSDDGVVDYAAEKEAGESEQRADNDGSVDFVDPVFVVKERVDRSGSESETGGAAGAAEVEDVCGEEAQEGGGGGSEGESRLRVAERKVLDRDELWKVGEDGVQEVLELIVSTEGQRDSYPAADDGEDGEDDQWEQHDPGGFVDSVGVGGLAGFILGGGGHVVCGVQVGACGRVSGVAVSEGVFVEAGGGEEGLEPEAEHVERG